ncbi:MAG TPA: hypothetical protein VEZ15_05955 [Acidimicrobiia bacterium]|nr:hypothetical protein [Acidimicrobiia bacterium]
MVTKEHVINRAEEHEDHPGETLVTRDHDVIRRWGRGPRRRDAA